MQKTLTDGTAVLFVRVKNGKPPKYLPVKDWLNYGKYIYKNTYTVIKRNKVNVYLLTWEDVPGVLHFLKHITE